MTLSAGQAVTLDSSAISSSTGRGTVDVAAPYILLAGPVPFPIVSGTSQPFQDLPGVQRSAGTLTLSGDLIDLQNAVSIGAAYLAQINLSNGKIPVARRRIRSPRPGERRRHPAAPRLGDGWRQRREPVDVVRGHHAQGRADLSRHGAFAEIAAGLFNYPKNGSNSAGVADNARAKLTIAQVGIAGPTPSSLFGQLTLASPTIEQGGTLRAPFGAIIVGASAVDVSVYPVAVVVPSTITFPPGSITSVSAAGASIPFGGSFDGITYAHQGSSTLGAASPSLFNYGNGANGSGRLTYGVAVVGQAIDVASGATLDLQGGGSITGAAFLPGRGGSTDTRSTPRRSMRWVRQRW